MKLPLLALVVVWSFSLQAQSTNNIFATALPKGWTVAKQTVIQKPPGRLTVVLNAEKKAQIQVQITVEEGSAFNTAAESWRLSAQGMAKQTGFDIRDEKYEISSHRSGKQASLSFHAMKSGGGFYSTCRFWIEDGLTVRVVAITAADASKDEEIKGIFDSIAPSKIAK